MYMLINVQMNVISNFCALVWLIIWPVSILLHVLS